MESIETVRVRHRVVAREGFGHLVLFVVFVDVLVVFIDVLEDLLAVCLRAFSWTFMLSRR